MCVLWINLFSVQEIGLKRVELVFYMMTLLYCLSWSIWSLPLKILPAGGLLAALMEAEPRPFPGKEKRETVAKDTLSRKGFNSRN